MRMEALVHRIRSACVAVLVLAGTLTAAYAREPRILVLAIDSVPYAVAAEVTDPTRRDPPLFRGFAPPTALITTFPSTTSAAFSGILRPLGLDPPPGYEVKFFDQQERRVRGGGLIAYHRIDFPWRGLFDWKLKGVARKAVAYGWPARFAPKELQSAVDAFRASTKRVFFAYITSTDALGHLAGPESMAEVLRATDEILSSFRDEHSDQPFHTVIFSDHGVADGQPLVNVRSAVTGALKAAGFHLASRLESQRDLVLVPFGLVSSLVVHTWPGRERQVARLAAAVPGIELCVSQEPEPTSWRIVSGAGDAVISRRTAGDATDWAYRQETGDPLGFEPLVQALRRRAGEPTASWFPDLWWFEVTEDSEYPDALYRLAESFSLVKNPASVVCSTAPGFLFGSRLTHALSRVSMHRVRWTHGALRRDASLGFLISDLPGWQPPSAVRFDRALELVLDAESR